MRTLEASLTNDDLHIGTILRTAPAQPRVPTSGEAGQMGDAFPDLLQVLSCF